MRYTIGATVTGTSDVEALGTAAGDAKSDLDALDGTTASVTVAESGVSDASTAMSDLATDATELDGTDISVSTTTTGVAEAAADIAGVGTAADDASPKVETFGTKVLTTAAGFLTGAGALEALNIAVQIGTKVWDAYTAKSRLAEATTRSVSEALGTADDAISKVVDGLTELSDSGTADAMTRLNAALGEGLDTEEFEKAVVALGALGKSAEDLAPSLQLIESDTGDVVSGMQALAEQSGIPPEYSESVARAVHSSDNLDGVLNELFSQILLTSGASEDAAGTTGMLTDTYGDQIAALEQLNDIQQNVDFEKIAGDQLDIARGTDLATAALVAQAESELGPDASDLAVWSRYVELQNEATAAAEARAVAEQQAEDAAEGAQALVDAMSSVDWQATEIEAATNAFTAYTDQMFAGSQLVADQMSAIERLGKATETESGHMALDMSGVTDASRDQLSALQGLAGVVDGQLATAYDNANGSQSAFIDSANMIRSQLVVDLQNELGYTADQANAVADALGMTEGDYQARFELAGAEQARLQLDLLGASIAGLPPEVETTVNQHILAGDYEAALATVQAFYDGNPAVVATEADPTGAEDGIAAVTEADHDTTITADADTAQAADDLLTETSRGRVAIIRAAALTQSASTELSDLTNEPRIADIHAIGYTAAAEYQLNNVARDRTATIHVRTSGAGAARASVNSVGSSGRAAGPMARTATTTSGRLGAGRAVAAVPSSVVYAPTVHVSAAVIGSQYDVTRAVATANRRAIRIAGLRQTLTRGGRVA